MVNFMKRTKLFAGSSAVLLGLVFSAELLGSGLRAQTFAKPANASTPTLRSRYTPTHYVPKRATMYYGATWGVDSLSVRAVESGELIRFSYRIVDPSKAKVFNDKKIDAFLESPKAHARLVIPSLEKVGQLRQYNQPEAGKSYWMAFSNPHLTVKRGDYVNVVIGRFHVEGIVVE